MDFTTGTTFLGSLYNYGPANGDTMNAIYGYQVYPNFPANTPLFILKYVMSGGLEAAKAAIESNIVGEGRPKKHIMRSLAKRAVI